MVTADPHANDDELVQAQGSVGVKAGGEVEGSAYNPMGYSENVLEKPPSAKDLQILPKPFKLNYLAALVARLTA
jgi:hypothetical protein